MKVIIYTADDEEPNCNMCCHSDGNDDICIMKCGPKHGWARYERIESSKENNKVMEVFNG